MRGPRSSVTVTASAGVSSTSRSPSRARLPKAGARWLIAAVLGAFHGLYFLLFVQSTGYHSAMVLTGAVLGEALAIAVLAVVMARVRAVAQSLRPVQACASALLVFGLAWFVFRLRG